MMSLIHQDLLSRDQERPSLLYFGGARMALLDIEAGFGDCAARQIACSSRRAPTVALYRIAQEALDDVAKHAEAVAPR